MPSRDALQPRQPATVPLGLQPVQIRTASSAVYTILREHILNGRLAPGDRLDLPVLEQQLAVSRSPLKDALSRLTSEGLIEIRPRAGTFVAPMTERRLTENFAVRAYLEQGASAAIVAGGRDAEMASIQALYDEMAALFDGFKGQEQLLAYLGKDHEFHSRIVALADNGQLTELYDQVNTHIMIGRITAFYTYDDLRLTHQDHTAIMAALIARDAPRLARSLGDHVTRSTHVALEKLARQRAHLADDRRDDTSAGMAG